MCPTLCRSGSERTREVAGPRTVFPQPCAPSHTPARRGERAWNSFLCTPQGNQVSSYLAGASLCGSQSPWEKATTGWPLPGAAAGRGDRAPHLTPGPVLLQLWGSEVRFSGLELGGAWRLPEQSPEEGKTCTVASRPRCTRAQRTSCSYFLRKHTFPWFEGRRGWGNLQGNHFPASCQEAG